MRFSFGLCPFLLTLLVLTGVYAQTAPPDKKQQEAKAKQLIAEGKGLEQQGKLAEARDKYVDSLGVISTSEALDAINHINDQEKQQVESLLEGTHRSFDAGKINESIQQLEHGLQIDPANSALHFDLALCYAKLGDRANAALHLDLAIGGVTNKKEHSDLLELRSSVLMGNSASPATEEAKKGEETFNESYAAEDRDPGDTKAPGGSLCDQIQSLKKTISSNPAIEFNSGKCASEEGRAGDAAAELANYIKLAPDALDRDETELLERNLSSLSALPGDSGQVARQHFATAARYLDYRRYDRAISEYQAAAQAAPEYPQTLWQMGLLYEAYGNVAKAREQLTNYEQLETDAGQKSRAESHLASLDGRRTIYDANVEEAQEILGELLLSAMGLENEGVKHKTKLTYRQWRWASGRYKEATRATEKLPEPYVERELKRARQDLESAAEFFPLGAEANELLALIYLQGNNWPEAIRSYDAVASQGFPVSFYAQVNSAHDSKQIRATKVEIGANAVRLVYLSTYDPKKQTSVAPSKPAGDDSLANLVISGKQPPADQAETMTIQATDLKGIETDKNFVVLKLQNEQIYLAPLNMLSEIPFEGGASRTFGNEYTRLFVRYLGYESAKLGKEGMTGGEKFKLGFEIARIGMSAGMMGMGAPMAYGSAVRMARLIHALQTFHSVAQGVRAVNIADASLRLADDIQMSTTMLERTIRDQQRAMEGMEFKIIPAQPPQMKYREKL
jgi:hypothetical protein